MWVKQGLAFPPRCLISSPMWSLCCTEAAICLYTKISLVCSNSRQMPRLFGFLSGKHCLLTMLHWPVTHTKYSKNSSGDLYMPEFILVSQSLSICDHSFEDVELSQCIDKATYPVRSFWAPCRTHTWRWKRTRPVNLLSALFFSKQDLFGGSFRPAGGKSANEHNTRTILIPEWTRDVGDDSEV